MIIIHDSSLKKKNLFCKHIQFFSSLSVQIYTS